jgi:hypothetical protein
MGAEVLTHFSKVMKGYAVLLEVNVSFLVIFVCGMRNCWSMSRYMIPVMVVFMKKKGLYALSFAEGPKHAHLWAVTNMFQEDTWIFTAPDPAVMVTDLTTDKKRALITENYRIQKSLIVLYPMKHLHTEFLTNHLICIRKVLNDG